MIKAFWILLASSIALMAAEGGPTKIGAAQVGDYYQRMATVTGVVAQVSIREKIVYLNLEKPFPASPFTGVIFSRATNQFGDLAGLKGRSVEITGRIEEFKEKPQIVLNSTNQLRILPR